MEEIIDMLDDEGKVIGTISKEQAHKTGAWHKAVHIYLINHKKQLLMQLRAKDKKIAPNVWDISVGGHVDVGEDTLTTAQRELEEELGISAKTDEFKYLFTHKEVLKNEGYVSREFVDVFIIKKHVVEKDITMQESEVSEFQFVDLKAFFENVSKREEKFTFHPAEYDKIIPILQKEFFAKEK